MGYEFVWGLSHIGCELINYQPIFTETKKDTRGSESTKPEKKISILQIWDIAGHQPWPHWSSLLEYCFSEGRALRAHGNPSLEFLWEFTRREKVEISEMGNEWTRLLRWTLAYIERWGGFKFENLPFFFFFLTKQIYRSKCSVVEKREEPEGFDWRSVPLLTLFMNSLRRSVLSILFRRLVSGMTCRAYWAGKKKKKKTYGVGYIFNLKWTVQNRRTTVSCIPYDWRRRYFNTLIKRFTISDK